MRSGCRTAGSSGSRLTAPQSRCSPSDPGWHPPHPKSQGRGARSQLPVPSLAAGLGEVCSPRVSPGCSSRPARNLFAETYLLVDSYCVSSLGSGDALMAGYRSGEGMAPEPALVLHVADKLWSSLLEGQLGPPTPSAVMSVLHRGQALRSARAPGRGEGAGRSWPWGSERASWGPGGLRESLQGSGDGLPWTSLHC